MKEKTEELLYHMLWACDMLWRPSFRHVFESFEGWAYRNGMMRQLAELERRKLIERHSEGLKPAFRLTEMGVSCALGGEDPEARWNRPWQGRWHLVLFDVPNIHTSLRNTLRDRLRDSKLGWLQRSVWVSPDPVTLDSLGLTRVRAAVESLILLEASPSTGETDAEIVLTSWDFPRINELYEQHSVVLTQQPQIAQRDAAAAEQCRSWAAAERAAWLAVCQCDPFLPRELLPEGYQGCLAWERRKLRLRDFGAQLRAFGTMKP
ncbi:MAG: hypothetical protein JNN07_25360 [Verrucomicrobiales bacterium]|nr:hypothetical protein [Verrucomicrobiales bacterium]